VFVVGHVAAKRAGANGREESRESITSDARTRNPSISDGLLFSKGVCNGGLNHGGEDKLERCSCMGRKSTQSTNTSCCTINWRKNSLSVGSLESPGGKIFSWCRRERWESGTKVPASRQNIQAKAYSKTTRGHPNQYYSLRGLPLAQSTQ